MKLIAPVSGGEPDTGAWDFAADPAANENVRARRRPVIRRAPQALPVPFGLRTFLNGSNQVSLWIS